MFDKKILTIIMCCTALIFASCGTTVKNNKQDDSSSRYIHTTKTQKITTIKTTTTKKKSTTTTTEAKPKSHTVTAKAVIEIPDTTTQTTAYTTPTTYTQPETTYQEELVNYGTSFEGTWYEGGYGTYGYSGRTLISGYSVASNYFPQGTIIQVSGSGLDGTYRVDDTGAMGSNVIDFYYAYGDVPSDFRNLGRVSITAYAVN